MLEEYMAFEGKKMPKFDETPPAYKWNIKINIPKNKSIYSKFSNLFAESLDDIQEEEMTLAEKIMQRQSEEKEKL